MKRIPAALLLCCSLGVCADPIDPLIGLWVSPDGYARQEFSRGLGGDFISTRMWFKDGGQWKLVGQGVIYHRPGQTRWQSVTRTTDMGGVALFESTITPGAEGTFRVANESFDSEGAVTHTTEAWTVEETGRFTYEIFSVVDGKEVPWMSGSWSAVVEE